MGLLKKLADIFNPPQRPDDRSYWLTVQCNRCGEQICSRVDLRNDLSIEYGKGENAGTTYFCRKVLMGTGRCFQQIEVTLTFDANHALVDQQISGGKFVDEG